METAIVSIICIALLIFGGMTMSNGFITSLDTGTSGLETAGQREENILRTELSATGTEMPSSNTLEVTLENSGQTKLADFGKWDVIVQYYDGFGNYYSVWLPYNAGTLGDNQWQVSDIQINGGAEVFDPNVLNPGEEIEITARLNPPVGSGTTNMVVVATPNGIPVETHFTGASGGKSMPPPPGP